jgi:hypothetical protein
MALDIDTYHYREEGNPYAFAWVAHFPEAV